MQMRKINREKGYSKSFLVISVIKGFVTFTLTHYFYCQRVTLARARGLRGGSIIKPTRELVLVQAEKISNENVSIRKCKSDIIGDCFRASQWHRGNFFLNQSHRECHDR